MFRRLSRVVLLILIACTLGACSTENAPINLTSLINEEETGELRGIREEAEDGSRVASSKSIIKVTPTVEPEEVKDIDENPRAKNSAGKTGETYDGIRKDGYYYDLESVVLYYEKFDRLPSNYLTKNKARALGWERGRLTGYKEGAAIGGDRFGNYERILPTLRGMEYIECDIDTEDSSRGEKRLVISNNKRYFYTTDHYATFREVVVRDGHISFGESFK